MAEDPFGAYAEKGARQGHWLVRLPEGCRRGTRMAIGTAGFTAMLSVLALEKKPRPHSRGWPGVVHRRAGAVGSVATAVLSKTRLSRHPSNGRMSDAPYLIGARAAEVDRIAMKCRVAGQPLARERWAGG